MALGRQGVVQRELLMGWHEVPRAPGHVFYDRLNAVLDDAGFDREVEDLCAAPSALGIGRPSIPPGRCFRMLFVGYFEGLESERGIAWRCADSLSLRQFLKLGTSEAVPDYSTLSRTRARLPLENMASAEIELTARDLGDIETAASKIQIQRARGTGHEVYG
jgi:Transposase domain (DUF772)